MNGNKVIFLLIIVISLFLTSCEDKENIIEPTILMKTVSQNTQDDLATFEFQLPEYWTTSAKDNLTVIAYSEEASTKDFDTQEQTLPYIVGISNYYYQGLALSNEEKQMYQDLFNGKTTSYENNVLLSLGVNDSSSNVNGISDIKFTYSYYKGSNGDITAVEYSFQKDGRSNHVIRCYREDIPYLITGVFDETLELSSGDIALWVADSLKVKEYFKIKDNVMEFAQ